MIKCTYTPGSPIYILSRRSLWFSILNEHLEYGMLIQLDKAKYIILFEYDFNMVWYGDDMGFGDGVYSNIRLVLDV